eukprot:2252394-Alexandrium_andersonii.AAC.1
MHRAQFGDGGWCLTSSELLAVYPAALDLLGRSKGFGGSLGYGQDDCRCLTCGRRRQLNNYQTRAVQPMLP